MNKFMPPKTIFLTNSDYEFITKFVFDAWYAKEIAPLFENAVEVYGFPAEIGHWREDGHTADYSLRALLIKIEPIKEQFEFSIDGKHWCSAESGSIIDLSSKFKRPISHDLIKQETAEDVLREIAQHNMSYGEIMSKAKVFLEREKK